MRALLVLALGLACFYQRIPEIDCTGRLGCFFSPELCESKEYCFNDLLFGHCKSQGEPYSTLHRHENISPPLQRLLEMELKRLWMGGYRWQHEYTQCVVQQLLQSEVHRINYDPGLCTRLLEMSLPDRDILKELGNIEPEDLAFIKFNPSLNAPHPEYADELFIPGRKNPHIKSTSTVVAIPGAAFEMKKSAEKRRGFSFEPHQSRHLSESSDGTIPKPNALLRDLLQSLDQLKEQERQEDENNDGGAEAWRWGLERGRSRSHVLEDEEGDEELDREDREGEDQEDGDDSDRFPDEELPVLKTDLSSDLDQRLTFSEGGAQWMPVSAPTPKEVKATRGPTFRLPLAKPQRSEHFYLPSQERGESGLESLESTHFFRTPLKSDHDEIKNQKEENTWARKRSQDQRAKNFLNNFRDAEKMEFWRPVLDNSDEQTIDENSRAFTRPMRYDIKKPGPAFFVHETDDEVKSNEEDEKSNPGEDLAEKSLYRLLKDAQSQDAIDRWTKFPKSSIDGESSRTGKSSAALTDLTGEENELQDLIPHPNQMQAPKLEENKPITSNFRQQQKLNDITERPKDKGQKEGPPYFYDEDDSSATKREYSRPLSISLPKEPEDKFLLPAEFKGRGNYEAVDSTHTYLLLQEGTPTLEQADKLTLRLESMMGLPRGTFSNIKLGSNQVTFKVNPNPQNVNASVVAEKAEILSDQLQKYLGITVLAAGIGDKNQFEVVRKDGKDHKLFILTFILCGGLAGILIAVAVVYVIRRHARSRQKLQNLAQPETEASQDYQDLCRQRMQRKNNEKPEPIQVAQQPKRVSSLSQSEASQPSPSSRSSTSSWSEEPVTSNMDISTGHMILSYMEDHLKNKDRLEREWEALCAYEAEPCATNAATVPQNSNKNRLPDILPYDHSRVVLNDLTNVCSSDYINASTITDHDPRNPAYIATQGPLPQTSADFWQMIWEQGSVVIVTLTRLMENGIAMCHRYWPEEGSEVYHIYEVHLVSEHIWCDDYLVRSFYLKNLKTSETRTVTQFHFLSWPENGVPSSTKALLEFRRKVNKSYRGRSCPIVAHCSDGSGRTGTYCLIDMVLNRMAKGAKEIDIAATLEHIRDQRADMVRTKSQFEFVLMAIAEEVHAILKALSQ